MHRISAIFLCILGLHISLVKGQDNYLQNPSLEGEWSTEASLPESEPTPEHWYSCQSWADPDQSSFPVAEGNNAARFRTRAIDYYDGGSHAPTTTEYMINELSSPIVVGGCYRFSAYLRHNPDIPANTQLDDIYSYPVKLEIRGAKNLCVQTMEEIDELELLGSTENAVEDLDFTRYEFSFYLEKEDYNYLMVRASWDSTIIAEPYNGIIELDNMGLELIEYADPPTIDTAYYKKIPPFQLQAANGYSWEWVPPVNLSNPSVRSPFLLNYNPTDTVYLVTIKDQAGCPVYQKFIISYLCDTVYEDEFFRTEEIYYKTTEDIELPAGDGIQYQWDETISGLSGYTIQEPIVEEFFDSITVDIVDNSKYACAFKEKFKLLVNCDTIFEDQDNIHYDTVGYREKTPLDPGPGKLIGPWEPTTWLDNPYSPMAISQPESSITYLANMIQRFNEHECPREEIFNIYIEKIFPNVITPGNDRENDVFEIPGLHPESSITIFDKSGSIVFEAKAYNYENKNWWGGISSKTNKPVPSGTYWYAIEEPGPFGTIKVHKGFVLVVW